MRVACILSERRCLLLELGLEAVAMDISVTRCTVVQEGSVAI